MLLTSETRKMQETFAYSCLTNKEPMFPGLKAEGLAVYQKLVQHVIADTLIQAFPIAYKTLLDEDWNALVHGFICNHPCQNWAIYKMPYEFYQYVSDLSANKSKYPFLNDLLLFEWMEIELFTMEDKELPAYFKEGDFQFDKIIVNPEHSLICVHYPVHKTVIENYNDHQGIYYLLGFRNIQTKEVSFLEVSILHTWLFEKLTTETKLLSELITEASKVFSIHDKVSLQKHLTFFLEDLKNQGAVLGFQTTKSSIL